MASQIADDEVQVWLARLEVENDDVARATSCLSADEIARADQYRFKHHRRRFIVARALLREMIGEYLERPAESIRFEYGASGKPSISAGAGPDLRFNLSHTKDVAMYAFARGREVGVDIEAVDAKVAASRVAEDFFSAGEIAALRSLSGEHQVEGFFNCWTRREACVKARGYGLSYARDSFEVSLRPGETARINRGDSFAGWSMYSFRPTSDEVAALVVEGVGVRVGGPRFR